VTMLRQLSNIATSLGFCLLIGLPLVKFSAASWTDPLENRNSAPMPSRPGSLSMLKAFPAGFEAFFNDHFGLRKPLIRLRNAIDFTIFKRSPTLRVLLGKDNWLFYTGDRSIEDYRGLRPFSENELDQWYRALKQRRDWLAARGIAYHFVVAPNKESIYPEYMPDSVVHGAHNHLDELVAYLTRKGEASLVEDLRPALITEKSSLLQYHPIDAHWNPWGAYLAYRAIVEQVDADGANALQSLTLSKSDFAAGGMRVGDLADMMRFRPYPVPMPTTGYIGLKLPCGAHEATPEPALAATEVERVRPDLASDCTLTGNDRRAVIFHDSMILAMADYMANSFSHIRFGWMAPSLHDIKLYIEAEHPDVVIEEHVERTLINLPVPEHAVNAALSALPPPLERGGWVDVGETGPSMITLDGWGWWGLQGNGRKIMVNTNLSIDGMTLAGGPGPTSRIR